MSQLARYEGPTRSLDILYHILQQQSGDLAFNPSTYAFQHLLQRGAALTQTTPLSDVVNHASKVLSIVAAWRIDPQQRQCLFNASLYSDVNKLTDRLLTRIRTNPPTTDDGFAVCIALLLRCAMTPLREVHQRGELKRQPGLRLMSGSAFAAETARLAEDLQEYVVNPSAVLVYEEVVWCLSQQVYPAALLTLARIVQGRDTQSFLFGEVAVLLWFLQATHDFAWPDESLESLKFGTYAIPSTYVTRFVPPLLVEQSEGFIGAVGLFEPDPQLRSYENIPL